MEQQAVEQRPRERLRVALVHIIEALMSAAANLLTIGIYFYMQHEFGWSLKSNFMLSSALGVFYISGALVAHRLTNRFGPRKSLVGAYLIICLLTIIAATFISPIVSTIVILLFAFCSATTWPIIENLVSAGNMDPHELSRRLSLYNIVWAATGAGIIAVNGLIIETMRVGVFLIPAAASFISAVIAFVGPIEPNGVSATAHAHLDPEPTLARQRVVALWLSRICVPAMYLVIYSLAAMLPSLPVIAQLRPAMQTLVSSVWLVTRWAMFVILGATVFWHTRPRLLLVAAGMLLISLLMITLPQGLAIMILGQIAFGAATGLIYMASLYFGMVLSEGSTEHGGYHEALIGLGMTLGPAVGAGTQWFFPGNQNAAIAGIAGLVVFSVALASFASLRLRRQRG